MAMTIVASGKIYFGKVFEFEDKKTGDDRSVFRGRLNYRDRATREWHFIDVVCWKDFGDKGGLVAWLDDHFSKDAESSVDGKGGQPIEIVGYLKPSTTKTNDLIGETKSGKKGKVDVVHPTFELVIESADFPPAFEKYKGGTEKVDEDFDFDEDEELEEDDIDEPEEIDEDDEEEEVVEPPKRTRNTRRQSTGTGTRGKSTSSTKKDKEPKKTGSTGRKRNTKVEEPGEEDPFFEQ